MVNVRARGQALPIFGAVFLVAAVLLPAAANLKPTRLPSDRELFDRDLLQEVVVARQARIGELQVAGDPCDLRRGRELVKLLAMDGQFEGATTFADRFESACGVDDDVHRWRDAPRPRHGRYARVATFDPTVFER